MKTKFIDFINESKNNKIEDIVKLHIYDIDNYISNINEILNDNDIIEDDENYEQEYQYEYENQLKSAILDTFFNKYKHGQPDNYLDLLDSMEYYEIEKESTKNFKVYKIVIEQPEYDDDRNISDRYKKIKHFKNKIKYKDLLD